MKTLDISGFLSFLNTTVAVHVVRQIESGAPILIVVTRLQWILFLRFTNHEHHNHDALFALTKLPDALFLLNAEKSHGIFSYSESLSIGAELVCERDAVSRRWFYTKSMIHFVVMRFRISTVLKTLSGEAFRCEAVNSSRRRSTLRPRNVNQSAALACFTFATIDSILSPSPVATPVPYAGSAL